MDQTPFTSDLHLYLITYLPKDVVKYDVVCQGDYLKIGGRDNPVCHKISHKEDFRRDTVRVKIGFVTTRPIQ